MSEIGDFELLIKQTVHCLNEVAIDYCIVGTIAASYYGSVRSTEDIDLMVKLESREKAKIFALVECFQKNNLSITSNELIMGLEENSPITVFGLKNPILQIDLKRIRTKLDHSTYALRREADLFGSGKSFWISSPESLIVAKLLPSFQSEKDLDDVRGILLRFSDIIDWSILETLSVGLGSDKLLLKIKDELQIE